MAEENIHKGHRKRMRARVISEGAGSLENHELLEMLLYYCIPQRNTNEMAHRILNEFGNLPMVIDADPVEMGHRAGVSETASVLFALISEVIKRYNKEKWVKGQLLNASKLAGEYAVALLAYEDKECFYVICLDSQN